MAASFPRHINVSTPARVRQSRSQLYLHVIASPSGKLSGSFALRHPLTPVGTGQSPLELLRSDVIADRLSVLSASCRLTQLLKRRDINHSLLVDDMGMNLTAGDKEMAGLDGAKVNHWRQKVALNFITGFKVGWWVTCASWWVTCASWWVTCASWCATCASSLMALPTLVLPGAPAARAADHQVPAVRCPLLRRRLCRCGQGLAGAGWRLWLSRRLEATHAEACPSC